MNTIKELKGLRFPDEYVIKFFFKSGLHASPGRVVEFGCGNGNNLSLFRAYGWDVTGLAYQRPPHRSRKPLKNARQTIRTVVNPRAGRPDERRNDAGAVRKNGYESTGYYFPRVRAEELRTVGRINVTANEICTERGGRMPGQVSRCASSSGVIDRSTRGGQ